MSDENAQDGYVLRFKGDEVDLVPGYEFQAWHPEESLMLVKPVRKDDDSVAWVVEVQGEKDDVVVLDRRPDRTEFRWRGPAK